MIILYRMRSDSPNIRKVTIMLKETRLPFSIQYVDKQSDGEFAADFLAINPNATVPAIVDTDTGSTIFESGAILYYLAQKTSQLFPADLPAQAEVIKWLMFEVANMGPTMVELYHYLLMDDEQVPATVLRRYQNKLVRYCTILNQQLHEREYLCAEYSIADIALYPWSVILEDMAEINLADYPNLHSWAVNIGNRPALQAATGT